MASRPTSFISQEWSVHAQLTISHQHPPDVITTPPTPRLDNNNGVHMEYSWNTVPQVPRPCYGFQRGNITFTTTPPAVSSPHRFPDDQVPNSGLYGSLPTRGKFQQPYNRRCKSTCSITLSGVYDDSGGQSVNTSSTHQCGDHPMQEKPVLPVEELCEVCGGGRSPSAQRRATNYTTHFCTRVPERIKNKDEVKQSQDAASQTLDLVKPISKPAQPRMGNKAAYTSRRKTDSDLLQVPVLDIPESLVDKTKAKPGKRLSRSPARLSGKSPMLAGGRKSSSGSPDSVKKSPALSSLAHKPRTVHIDVYCTGSDASGSSSDSSLDSDVGDSWTSPQTVFESEKLRVIHERAGKDRLPQALKQSSKHVNIDSERGKSESFNYQSVKEETISRGYDSDDGLSSQYPSQFSSYSSIQKSSGTSRDPSSSTISSSSCVFSDTYDSAAATSCKDTATDFDALSLKYSDLSLAPSDSFEYADSADRLRIKQRERDWASKNEEESKTWRSPQSERKHMLQQQKFKEFLEKHLGKDGAFPLWKAEKIDDSEEDDDDDDETGDAWSFGGESSTKVSTLKREDTVRKAVTPAKGLTQVETDKSMYVTQDVGSLSDSSPYRFSRRVIAPFRSRSPSPELLKVQSTITSPFTTQIGVRTDQLSKAERFGTIVGAFRKPGHHVGPSKNPECSCAHCRNYCEQIGYRSRTRSLDISLEAGDNWKTQLQQQIARRNAMNLVSKNIDDANDDSYEEHWEDSTAV